MFVQESGVAEFYGETLDGQPACRWNDIQASAAKHRRFTVRVEKYDRQKEISLQQMRYLHGVVFPAVARAMCCSLWEAEYQCKVYPGEQWLTQRMGQTLLVLSKTTLNVQQTNAWIENIHDWAQKCGFFVPPPDKDWRTARQQKTATKNL
jgi:hypothetical protein